MKELFDDKDIIHNFKIKYDNIQNISKFRTEKYDLLVNNGDNFTIKGVSNKELKIEYYSNEDLFTDEYINYIDRLKFRWSSSDRNEASIFAKRKKEIFNRGIEAIENSTNNITFSRYDPGDNSLIYYDDKKKITTGTILNGTINIDITDMYLSEFEKSEYEYNEDNNNTDAYNIWVDFANPFLGGGVFDTGYVQEEIMFLQIPQLAAIAYKKGGRADNNIVNNNHIKAKPFLTRYQWPQLSNPTKITKAKPTPIIFKNVKQVIKTSGYGRYNRKGKGTGLVNITGEYIENKLQEHINILAISAPYTGKLMGKNEKFKEFAKRKKDIAIFVITDILNTLIVGFEHVYLTADPNKDKIIINSGKLGSGNYGNDPIIVCVLHYFAQLYINQKYNANIIVKLWFISNHEERNIGKLLNILIDNSINISLEDLIHKLYEKYITL